MLIQGLSSLCCQKGGKAAGEQTLRGHGERRGAVAFGVWVLGVWVLGVHFSGSECLGSGC